MTLTQILSKLKSLVYSKTETDTLLGNKAASSHTHSDYVPKSGGSVMSGTDIGRINDSSYLTISGGSDSSKGASITLYGKDSASLMSGDGYGIVKITAKDDIFTTTLTIQPNGWLTVNNSGLSNKTVAFSEDVVSKEGGPVITGWYLGRTTNDDKLFINGGRDDYSAHIELYGRSKPSNAGNMVLVARDTQNYMRMDLKPDGTLTWGPSVSSYKNIAMVEDVIPRSGGAVITGDGLYRTSNTSYLELGGGTYYNDGAVVAICGATWRDAGLVAIKPHVSGANGSNSGQILNIWPSGTLTWSGTAIQYGSDQRLKQQISEIDDKLLDAWEDVLPCQFKYNDAVDQKGDTARLHTGYVVQQIDEACKSHNLDISAYGLYCHEEYSEETEEVEVEQEDGTKIKERKVIREASEHYSLRYTETLVVECAFLRREIKRLSERLSKLEQPSTSEK